MLGRLRLYGVWVKGEDCRAKGHFGVFVRRVGAMDGKASYGARVMY